jgi:uncharacterized LabA/DUF88 family protein
MRVAIFFDGKNYHKGWESQANGRKVDFPKMAAWLVGRVQGVHLWGAYYYTGVETGPAGESAAQKNLARFLNKLEILPGFFVRRFERKVRRTRCRHCRQEQQYTQEKEVDTTMVADMLRLAAVNAFDIMVLVSGDRDHAPAVDGVLLLGKKVYVASWAGLGLAQRIRKAAFDHIDLTEGLDHFAEPAKLAPSAAGTATQPSSLGVTQCPSDAAVKTVPSEGDSQFLNELRNAEAKFSGAYVGLNYFLRKWRSSSLDPSPEVRGRILDRLVSEGKIEIYRAPDANQAVRTVVVVPTP